MFLIHLLFLGYVNLCSQNPSPNITVESTIDQINIDSFSSCKNGLASVNFQFNSQLKQINDSAFSGFPRLTVIDLSACKFLISLGKQTFASSALKRIIFPDAAPNLKTFDEGVFSFLTDFSIKIPKYITSFKGIYVTSDSASFSKTRFSEFSFEEGSAITDLPLYAFSHAVFPFSNFIFPDNLVTFSGQPFLNCFSITSFEISPKNPNFMTIEGCLYQKNGTTLDFALAPPGKTGNFMIPNNILPNFGKLLNTEPFRGSYLETIDLSNSHFFVIPSNAFYLSRAHHIYIPDCITHIDYGAFSGSSLVEFKIPNDLQSLSWSLFYGAMNLTIINYNNFGQFPQKIFEGCVSLRMIRNFPHTIISVGENAFRNCLKLCGINVQEESQKENLITIGGMSLDAFIPCPTNYFTKICYSSINSSSKMILFSVAFLLFAIE